MYEIIVVLSISLNIPHIIEIITDNIQNINVLTEIILNIALGVGAFKGLMYLKRFQEKRESAIFTFWLQLKVRLMEIRGWIKSDKKILNYFYDSDSRSTWESESAETSPRLKSFKNLVVETISFIKETPDQIPAYHGWTDDYTKIVCFLEDIIQYDICDGDDYFKFHGQKTVNDRDAYCEEICEILDRMCHEIEERQKEIEEKLQRH